MGGDALTGNDMVLGARRGATAQADPDVVVGLVGVVKAFGAFHAVDGVSLNFAAGETVGLVGPNGAGKTTLFGLISGAHAPTTGEVRLRGRDITRWDTLRRARGGISRTFQTARVFPALTVAEHLALVLPSPSGRRLGWSTARLSLTAASRASIVATAAEYGLGDALDVEAASLPQAQRKVLDLALALVTNPSVLLLDEPTAGVAREDVATIGSLLGDLRRRHPGATVIISSHDADLIARLCARIVVLVRGHVLADGPTEQVVNDPRVRAAYFGGTVDA